jgi:ABC-type glycerol-3-phosphate transport system permease component
MAVIATSNTTTTHHSPGYRARRMINRVLFWSALLLFTLWVVFPFYWMITTSLRPDRELYSRNVALLPQNFTLQHYQIEFTRYQYADRLRNSLIVASATALTTLVVSCLGAFSITRLRYPGRAALARSILLVYLIPGSLLFIPMYTIMARIGLTNNLLGLAIAYLSFAVPFCTWMMMGYFKNIPVDMEEAAMIDGCTRFQSFTKVLLPLTLPAIAASGIFSFTLAWNEFLYALVFITDSKLQTLPVGLSSHITADIYMWGPLMAGSAMASVPIVLLYVLAQRALVQGIFAGAVRG